MMAVRFPRLIAIPISDIGIGSAISQAITDAPLYLTVEAGRNFEADVWPG
jgi:hypothetical protein